MNGHGGKRDGAGRPRFREEGYKKAQINVTMEHEEKALLSTLAKSSGMNVNSYIKKVIFENRFVYQDHGVSSEKK